VSGALDILTRTVRESRRLVWITGAGLSVASGIPSYRRGADAVWSRFVTDWGTRARFESDTLRWWRDFWLDFHDLAPEGVTPNPGHLALAHLVAARPDHLVITQNVDGLHRASGVPPRQLVEIHGRHGLYRCTSARCSGFRQPSEDIDLSGVSRGEIPRCERCGAKLRPLVLLFDERYDSHPFFRAEEAFEAVALADALVFVGTSFAVGITELALDVGRRHGIPILNVNVEPYAELHPASLSRPLGLVDVLGPAEDSLPDVAARLLG